MRVFVKQVYHKVSFLHQGLQHYNMQFLHYVLCGDFNCKVLQNISLNINGFVTIIGDLKLEEVWVIYKLYSFHHVSCETVIIYGLRKKIFSCTHIYGNLF